MCDVGDKNSVGDNTPSLVVVTVSVEKCDSENKVRVGNNIQPTCLKVSCLVRKEIFLLRPNDYKLFVLLTFSCVQEN